MLGGDGGFPSSCSAPVDQPSRFGVPSTSLPKPPPFVKKVAPSEPETPAPERTEVAQKARDRRNAGRRAARRVKGAADIAVAEPLSTSACT